MPSKLFSLLVALLVTFNAVRADEPSKPAPKKVFVEVLVVEVALDRLRAIGFDWSTIADSGTNKPVAPDNLVGFLKALRQYKLTTVLAEPSIMTLDGRPATLAIGDQLKQLKLEIVPIVKGDNRIRVEYRLELTETGFKSDSAVEVEPGQAVIASQVRSETKDAAGKVREVATMVIVRADTKPTAGIGTADASAPDSTSRPAARLQAPTYQEIESRPIKR